MNAASAAPHAVGSVIGQQRVAAPMHDGGTVGSTGGNETRTVRLEQLTVTENDGIEVRAQVCSEPSGLR